MPGPSLIPDIRPEFQIDANSDDLEKARLVTFLFERAGFGQVFTGPEYATLVQQVTPQLFSRAKLVNLSATGLIPLLASFIPKAVELGMKYVPPVYDTVR